MQKLGNIVGRCAEKAVFLQDLHTYRVSAKTRAGQEKKSVMRMPYASEKIKEELGWKADITLEQMCIDSYNWVKKSKYL